MKKGVVNIGSVRERSLYTFINSENTGLCGKCKVFVISILQGCTEKKIVIP